MGERDKFRRGRDRFRRRRQRARMGGRDKFRRGRDRFRRRRPRARTKEAKSRCQRTFYNNGQILFIRFSEWFATHLDADLVSSFSAETLAWSVEQTRHPLSIHISCTTIFEALHQLELCMSCTVPLRLLGSYRRDVVQKNARHCNVVS